MTAENDPLPETAAAESLRRHLEEIARERDRAHRALQEREAELARIQRIARVGGLEIDFRGGVRNRRSPEYLLVHGLPPEAATRAHQRSLRGMGRAHPPRGPQTHDRTSLRGAEEHERGLHRRIPDRSPE